MRARARREIDRNSRHVVGLAEPAERAARDKVVADVLDDARHHLRQHAAAEAVVRAALERGLPEAITRDGVDFAPSSTEVLDIFSAGPRVAFHVRHVGTYRGGFADAPAAKQDIVLYSAGLVDVSGDAVTGGRVIRDRAALRRQLEPARP